MSQYSELCRDMENHSRQNRDERLEQFKKTILPQLDAYEVNNPAYGTYTINVPEFGVIGIFPKSDRLLIQKENKWLNGAEKWIIKNIFKETE